MTALTFGPLIDAGGGLLALCAMGGIVVGAAWLEERWARRSRRGR